jgi:hypothetical protein
MSSAAQPLLDFIGALKSQGASDEFVVALLKQNGWSEKRIYQAFSAWYETRTGRAVPNGGGRIEAAKDAFLYLLAFMTLGIWAIQLGALLFAAIDRIFPNPALDPANATWVVTRNMADDLAGILVGFPLFLLVTWGIVRGVRRQPERLESSVRKWLTYIALVITAGTMIGDVVTFLAYFLRGDLDTRFVLKVVTVLVIAGGVFAYYLDSLRRERVSSIRNRSFALAALAVVGFGIVVGFVQTGSPAVQRSESEDARRLFDLSSIAQSLHVKWLNRGQQDFVLPTTIQDLQKIGLGLAAIVDPVNGRTYEYTPLQGTTYRLCAGFSRPSSSDVPREWYHRAGPVCFTLDASENVDMLQRRW